MNSSGVLAHLITEQSPKEDKRNKRLKQHQPDLKPNAMRVRDQHH